MLIGGFHYRKRHKMTPSPISDYPTHTYAEFRFCCSDNFSFNPLCSVVVFPTLKYNLMRFSGTFNRIFNKQTVVTSIHNKNFNLTLQKSSLSSLNLQCKSFKLLSLPRSTNTQNIHEIAEARQSFCHPSLNI